MAKQPETRDRYRIHGETTLEQFGFVLAELTKLGLQNVGYELITDVSRYKDRERRIHDVPGHEFAREYIKEHPTFQINAIVKHFAANNRSGAAGYAAVKDLVKENFVRKLSPGNYQLAAMKALPAPKKALPAPKDKAKQDGKAPKVAAKTVKQPKFRRVNNKPMRYYAVSNKDFLLNFLKGKTDVDASAVNDYFAKDGRPTKSAGSLLTQLAHLGYCKAMGGGHWKVLAKTHNTKGSIAARRSTPQQINGIDVTAPAVAPEEIANG